MIKFKFLIILLILYVETICCQDCENGWVKRPNSNSCYFFGTEDVTNLAAVQKCTDSQSTLVSISDDIEQTYLESNSNKFFNI